MHKLYNNANKEAFWKKQNGMEWLADFINFSAFACRCFAWKAMKQFSLYPKNKPLVENEVKKEIADHDTQI